MTHVPVPDPSRDGDPAPATASVSTTRSTVGNESRPLRDTLLPLDALCAVARLALGVPLVAIASVPGDGGVAPHTALQPSREDELFGRDTPLSAVLAIAVKASGSVVMIEDARSHPLIRATPVVRATRVMACLAVPVRDARGQIVGALCAWDGIPRWWTDDDVRLLSSLSTGIGALMRTAEARDGIEDSVQLRASTREHPEALMVLEALPDGLLLLDAAGAVRWSNAHVAEYLGLTARAVRTSMTRAELEASVNPAVRSAWRRATETGQPTRFAWHDPERDRFFEGDAVPVASHLAVAIRNVTLARHAERARDRRAALVRESETLDAVAVLAGGVAHDFNNLLTVIAANAELLHHTPLAEEASIEISEIHRATSRATKLTQLLLACGRQLPLESDVVLLNALIGKLEPTIVGSLPTSVRVETSLTSQDTRVRVDPSWFEQVVLQLVRNARDAMPEGGTLRISTSVHELVEVLPARPRTVPAGVWLVLEVQDTGHGVAPGQLDRLFEPFFTTRDIGSGLGLGLAAAYGIMAQSGGTCTVDSEHGKGTTLRLWLPALTPHR